ncbi:hypothetical protein DER46DRAFT_678118 [Fusarium sp. MPI-SDFR-AT-0072]|nr:hypothetical protein DER46DRAFT_678118 [Fusarium sp. MPI-SDFR-AT-0072]
MPYNPRSEVQYIGPRCRRTKALLLLKQGGPEAALAVVRRTYFRTKTRQLCWSITQSAVSNVSRLCHSIISDICHSSQGFSGRLCTRKGTLTHAQCHSGRQQDPLNRSLVNWAKTAQYLEPGTIEPRLSFNRGTHELSPKKGPRTSKIQPSFAAETPLQHGDVLPCITLRHNASTYYCMLIFDIISAAIACCPTHMNPDRRCDVEQRANQG